jgi:lysophospholipase L1-like esterase
MSDLHKHETQPHPDVRSSSASSTVAARSSGSRVAASLSQFLARCCSFLGYSVVLAVLAVALLELASWTILRIHPIGEQAGIESQQRSPVYAGVEWAGEFWQEETSRQRKHTVYVPFRLWSVTNWHGKYINNDPGMRGVWRRTMNPANCGPPYTVTVWTFGGSTMYGTAVPDWATIPSYLSRDLNARSRDCVVVSNFGVEGYVTDQELILLGEQLKAGGHPNIVIFYDGINDAALAYAPSSPPDAHFYFHMIKTRIEGSLSGRLDFLHRSDAVRLAEEVLAGLRPAKSFASLYADSQPNVVIALDNYEANMRLVRVLGEAYKFKLYCFWQPILIYDHKPLVPFEQQMVARDTSVDSAFAWFRTIADVYRQAELRAAKNGNFVFLGNVFDSTREPIYVDEAHLGPRGNELVAQAIATYIQDHPEQ